MELKAHVYDKLQLCLCLLEENTFIYFYCGHEMLGKIQFVFLYAMANDTVVECSGSGVELHSFD